MEYTAAITTAVVVVFNRLLTFFYLLALSSLLLVLRFAIVIILTVLIQANTFSLNPKWFCAVFPFRIMYINCMFVLSNRTA